MKAIRLKAPKGDQCIQCPLCFQTLGHYKYHVELKYPSLPASHSVSTQSSRERFLDNDYVQVTEKFIGCQYNSNDIASEAQSTTNSIDNTYSTGKNMEQQNQTHIETFPFAGQVEENEEPWSGPPDGQNLWKPFINAHDFKLAHWFVKSHITVIKINEYFNYGLFASQKTSFSSAWILQKELEQINNELGDNS